MRTRTAFQSEENCRKKYCDGGDYQNSRANVFGSEAGLNKEMTQRGGGPLNRHVERGFDRSCKDTLWGKQKLRGTNDRAKLGFLRYGARGYEGNMGKKPFQAQN
jgi:hypothetical protein